MEHHHHHHHHQGGQQEPTSLPSCSPSSSAPPPPLSLLPLPPHQGSLSYDDLLFTPTNNNTLLDSDQLSNSNAPDSIDWVSLLSGGTGLFSGFENVDHGSLLGGSSNTAGCLSTGDQNGGGENSNKDNNNHNMINKENYNYKKMRNNSRMKKATRPRFAFHTRSPDDILDDGYRWRKYGQKAVKNSVYPR